MHVDLKQARERRNEIARAVKHMAEKAESENRSLWNSEEEARLARMFSEFCGHLEIEKASAGDD